MLKVEKDGGLGGTGVLKENGSGTSGKLCRVLTYYIFEEGAIGKVRWGRCDGERRHDSRRPSTFYCYANQYYSKKMRSRKEGKTSKAVVYI